MNAVPEADRSKKTRGYVVLGKNMGASGTRVGKPQGARSHHPARVSPEMVEGWHRARRWILDRVEELAAVGWSRRQLFAAGRFRAPCGPWGLAWAEVWNNPGVDVKIRPDGVVAFTWQEAGRSVTQTARPAPWR